MGRIRSFWTNIFDTKVDAIGLSVFRILYFIVVLAEVLHLYKWRSIVYDKVPFVYSGEIEAAYLFYFWIILLLFLIFGLFTRFALIVNYLFSILIFSSAKHFEYHVFYTYTAVNFVLMFMPISRVLSLDSLIQKIKYTGIGRAFQVDRKVLLINYLVPVFVGIGITYFDSIFHKLSSRLWLDGLGVWLPTSLPMCTPNDLTAILNQKFLVIFLGYFVLFFEAVYFILIWFKKFRLPVAIIGIFFHLGIYIAYPIPFFALTYAVLNLLLLPVSYWQSLARVLHFKHPLYTFYYDAECPLCNKVIVVIRHFDIFKTIRCVTVQGNYQSDQALSDYSEEVLLINIHGVTKSGKVHIGFWAYVQLLKSMIYTYPIGLLLSVPGISHLGIRMYNYIAGDRLTIRCTAENCQMPILNEPVGEEQDYLVKGWNRLAITKRFWVFVLLFLFIIQCMIIWFSPTIRKIIPQDSKINHAMEYVVSKNVRKFFDDFFGAQFHAVFVDLHFKDFNHIVKIERRDGDTSYLVPFIDDKGLATGYNSGIIWRNFSFNILTSKVQKHKIEDNIVPYLKFYIQDYRLDETEYVFDFFVKEIEVPKKWERNFLRHQMAKPWVKAGTCTLKDEKASFHWNESAEALFRKEALQNK